MKNWLKILTGKTTTTASEIQAEIDNLKTEQAGIKAKLLEAKGTLSQARMELYGGSGDQAGVDALEGDVRSFQIQVDTLDKAVMDLTAKHGEAIEREKHAQVAKIDKQIADLKKWGQEIRREYARVKTLCRAYERLLTAPVLGVGMASNESLLLTRDETDPFEAEAEKITNGHRQSIMGQIIELREKRKALLEQ